MHQKVTSKISKYRKCESHSGILIITVYLFFFLTTLPFYSLARSEPQYDEISVFLNIQRFGGVDIPAVIQDESVFLPVVDIFSFLKIKNNPSAQLDSVTGSFINPMALYSIDMLHSRITFQGKVYSLNSNDLIRTETNLYLKSDWFGRVFGLECTFNFRSLSVQLTTKLELPVIREMRLEQMRANISRLKGEVKTDTTIERKYPAFHFGMADWSIISSQQLGGRTDTRLNLALGAAIAGGEANALLNYNNNTRVTEKQQQYQWRFVNNDRPILRQVTAGKIYSQVTSSIYDPVVGIQFTNTPTTYRRSFGTYTLSDITEPNWTVELYVNNVLVDYMKADGSGFFKFEVPLVYGNSAVKLKFYGPWGEERIKEQNISIPFNFLPPKELEYTLSAGMVEDTLSSRFSRANLNYGVSRRITVGGGVEYLSSVVTGTSMPFLNASVRLLSGLLVTGEYTYGVRSRGILSYRLPSNLQIELNYAKYNPGQKAIIYNYLEERKAVVSIPINTKNFAAYSRMTVNQIVLPGITNTNAEMLWSGSVYGVTTNFTTYGLFTDIRNPFLYSNLSLAFRLPARITLTPQAQYQYSSGKFISTRVNFEKPLFKHGFLNMSFEQNFVSNTRNLELGFRYDFSFAQTGFSVRNANNETTMIESARGSLLYDRKSKYLGTTNRNNVGKGAITLLPYLDINGNGKRDKGEPKVAGLQFRLNGGTIILNEKDTTIHILDLIPYTSYLLELDKNSFDNLSWQMHNLSMKVNIDANQFQNIEVPVAVMGEASGTVYNESKGQGRMIVCFYRDDSTLASRTMTESDGYYSYLGLKPGKYSAKIDPEQLKKLKMISVPEQIPINILPSREGTIIDGLDFNLSLIYKEPVKVITPDLPPAAPSVEGVSPAKSPSTAPAVPTPAPVAEVPSKSELIKQPKVLSVAVDTVSIQAKKIEKSKALLDNASPQPGNATHLNEKNLTKTASPQSDTVKAIKNPVVLKRFGSVIQVGAFVMEQNAIKVKEDLIKKTDLPVDIFFEDGLHKVQISGFQGRKKAFEYLPKLAKRGYREAFVVRTD